jgi:hypothetical protein
MTKALAQTYNIANEHKKRLAYAMIFGCLFLVFIYAMNLYRVISRTVAIQDVNTQTVALAKSVDGLDSRYLELASQATPDKLSEYGMTQGEVTEYISRTASLGRVALGGHEL